jgi:hypothetical protein
VAVLFAASALATEACCTAISLATVSRLTECVAPSGQEVLFVPGSHPGEGDDEGNVDDDFVYLVGDRARAFALAGYVSLCPAISFENGFTSETKSTMKAYHRV